ncbi:MAG: hypothetical protein PVG62_07935, partial [Desulfobacterales bacterium]
MMHNCNGGSRKRFRKNNLSEAAGLTPQIRLFSILRHLSALLISLFVLAGTSLAETYVSGNITSDTTWGVAGSPYIVTGDITVRHSSATHFNTQTAAVLTIE